MRQGLERILLAKRGALIVVGDGATVLSVCTGGFLLDAEFSPQRVSELAKLDGAIILSPDAHRIARANVHLMPDPSIWTSETGTRHRTAERVARSIDVPVISVSAAMSVVTVYRGDEKHLLQTASRLHERVGQALASLQRFRHRFDLSVASLGAVEVEDTVTMRDVAAVIQPGELVCRISEEVEVELVELGEEGRLLRLQLDELVDGVEDIVRLVVRDYVHAPDTAGPGRGGGADESPRLALGELGDLSIEELLDDRRVAAALGMAHANGAPDRPLEPRGYRLLHRLPRFPDTVINRIVEHFSGLQRIMRASVDELEEVGGVGEARARSVKDGLARLAEASILDRYS